MKILDTTSGTTDIASKAYVTGYAAPTTPKYVLGAADAALANGLVLPNLVAHPDIQPASPNAMDDEFSAGSLDGKWTALNQSTSSYRFQSSSIILYGADRTTRLWGIYQTTPGGSWTVACKMTNNSKSIGTSYAGAWLFVQRSANSKITTAGLNGFNGAQQVFYVTRLTDANTLSADQLTTLGAGTRTLYVSLAYDSGTGNITWSYSMDGLDYVPVYTEAQATFLGGAPDRVGIGAMPYGAAHSVSFDWFRRTA